MVEPGSPPEPTFNAMLLCDNAIREEGTRKISLIGIFANITAPQFPAVHRALCVYVNLGDAQGRYTFKLELIRFGEEVRVLGSGGAEFDAPDRMKPTEIVFELNGLVFESPGRYEFVLSANGVSVGRKSFDVVKLDQPPGEAR